MISAYCTVEHKTVSHLRRTTARDILPSGIKLYFDDCSVIIFGNDFKTTEVSKGRKLQLILILTILSFLDSTAQLRPWPPPQNPAEFLGGFSTIFFFHRLGLLAPRPNPIPEDQASVFISPRGRVATHFSRLLRHAWVTVDQLAKLYEIVRWRKANIRTKLLLPCLFICT
jgi:hypothetical protein